MGRQVFRIMDLPDRIVGFDGLPDNLLDGFELCRAEGFPRHWREWMGKIKKKIKIQPEKDPLTGQVRYYDPIDDEDCFFYLVDPSSNPSQEKWKQVISYVKQNVQEGFRLMDNIEEMAKPLAPNKSDGVSLEPEDVVIIPLIKPLIKIETISEPKVSNPKEIHVVKCDQCDVEFEGAYAKNAVRMHARKKHPKVEVASV